MKLEPSSLRLIQNEKMNSLGVMAAGVAHELNNPLTAILLFAQYCIKHTDKDDRRFEVLEDIDREVQRCLDIIRNFLTFSRAEESGEDAYQKADLAELISGVLRLLNYRIVNQNVSVSKSADSAIPEIWIRANTQQVFYNLLSNALDALQKSSKKAIDINIRLEGEHVKTKITDSGAGISS